MKVTRHRVRNKNNKIIRTLIFMIHAQSLKLEKPTNNIRRFGVINDDYKISAFSIK
jgi:hypothetical protein